MLVAGAPCQGFSQLKPPMGQAIGLEILKSLRGETFLELKI